MLHEFHMLNKASKDKFMTGSTSDVKKFALITSQKAEMQALSIINCAVEPHLLPILVKVKKILPKRPIYACIETRISHVTADMICARKKRW